MNRQMGKGKEKVNGSAEVEDKSHKKEKVINAYKAMRSLGIGVDTVRPVLKRLLQLYNNQWEFIEEENYRNLADAIFEAAEDEPEKSVEHEPPHKKAHKGLSGDNGCSTFVGAKTDADLEIIEQVRSTKKTRLAESSQSVPRDPVIESEHFGSQPTKKKKGIIGMSQSSREKEKDDESGSSRNQQSMIQTIQDIGSSTRGLVKVSLTCNSDAEQHKFHHPNVDDVLNLVERESSKRYRNIDGQFSLRELLNGICESYWEMGNSPLNISRTNKVPGSSHNLLGPTQESSMVNNPVRNRVKGAVLKDDITRGSEKVKISLFQECSREDLAKFTYMPSSEIYQSAYVHTSLARISDEDCCSGCKSNCISSSLPCACARDTGGEFAYTPEGLLNPRFLESCKTMKLDPKSHHMQYCHDCPLERIKEGKPRKCQGHVSRKFIKECWKKCGCTMDCGNRVVQRGISRKLQVFSTSEGKGWGVRTLEKLPAGAFICEYAGEILTNIELYERNLKRSSEGHHVYPVLLDADWATESVLKDEEALCLDATDFGNVARFMNHRCYDGNLLEIPVQVETLDRHYYHLAFFTTKEVEALEELTWDYGIDFDDHNHPIKAFMCRCGSKYCRGSKPRT